MDLPVNQIICGDCLEVMPLLPDKSIDMILCDLPYGTTACKWDTIIPFKPLWEQYERIIKDNRAIILTASQPFTTKLIESNFGRFKYELIWDKKFAGNFVNAKIAPLKTYEDVVVFGSGKIKYFPQMTKRDKSIKSGKRANSS
jgi:site-specific DNA-methyltransferase (adenine-specific)